MDQTSREPTPVSKRPHRRRLWLRLLLALLIIIVVLPLAAGAAFFVSLNPNAYKGRIEAAASQALGRAVTINGPLSLQFSLVPRIAARDVTVANLPGGTAPAMIHVARIETQVALLPLLHHRIEIRTLALRQPSILLERLKDGTPNWVFTPQGKPGQPAATTPAASGAAQPSASGAAWQVAVQAVTIRDGVVLWQENNGQAKSLRITTARLAAQGAQGMPLGAAPLTVSADLLWRNQPVRLSGQTGPIGSILSPTPGKGWPVTLTLAAEGAKLSAQGSFADPRHMAGYHFTVMGQIPAAEALTPLLPPGLLPAADKIPPLHQVSLAATLTDAGKGQPAFSNLSLQAGNSDLGSLLPGLQLNSLSLAAPALDQPLSINLLGQRHGFAFTLAGSMGPLTALLAPPPGTTSPSAQPPVPLPVDLRLTAGSSNIDVQGSIADPQALRGLSLSITADIAKLDALSPLLGVPLPPVPSLHATGMLRDGPAGIGQGLTLSAFNLTAPEGDIEGALTLNYGKRLAFSADLRSARLDLDGLLGPARTAAPKPAAPKPAVPQPAAPEPATATPAQPKGPKLLIPAIPLPIGLLREVDGTVHLAFASLRAGGTEYRALVAHARLEQGVFSLDPSSVVLPGGQVLVAMTIDAKPAVPQVTFAFQTQALAVAPLLKALGLPPVASGLTQAFARLSATGATTRALAADMTGGIGIASVNGTIDGRALAMLLAPAVHAAGPLPANVLSAAGNVPLHCFALRLDAVKGKAHASALLLDTSLLQLQGQGTVDFGTESLALALTPQIYLGEMDLTVPVDISGSLAAPKFGRVGKVVISQNSGGNSGGGINSLLQSVLGQGKARHGVSSACAPALKLARDGQPGEAPAGPGDTKSNTILNRPINFFDKLLNGR